MGISADTRQEPAAPTSRPATPGPAAGPHAPLGLTFALTVTLAVACFALVMTSLELLLHPAQQPPPFDLGERQSLESVLYLVSFAVILPLALIAVPRLADAIAAGPNADALSSVAGLLVASFAGAILVARLADAGVGGALGFVGAWWIGALGLLALARGSAGSRLLLRSAGVARAVWALAGGLLLVTPLAFTALKSISPIPLVVGLVAVPLVPAAYERRAAAGSPRKRRRLGLALDGLALVLILLAIPDLVIFRPAASGSGFLPAFKAFVVQFHQDFVLGPTNQVLHGGAVLVDTASQYGIAPIYLLAGWFKLVPIGYGMLGLLDGILFALVYAAGYGVLRLARTPRPLAAAAIAVGVIVLIYNLLYSVGSLPAQHGPLRFGLPMVAILAATAEARWPRRGRIALAAQLAAVGLASIWALEAFAYTVLTFAAIVWFQAWTRPRAARLGWAGRRAVLALAACVATHLVFVGATLAAAGKLPDYGWYLDFARSFLFGRVGDITYDFAPWSAALAVGAGYAASAAGLVLLLRRRPDMAERERPGLIALAGTTAYGIALFSYFVDRSALHVLPYVSLPLLLAGTLWLSLLVRGSLGASRALRLGGLAFALGLTVLLTSVAWSSVGDRFDRSALGHLVPGGPSLHAAFRRLWHPPPFDGRRTPEGERLIASYMPGQERVLSLVTPDLETEILIRTGRVSRLPLGYPPEDSFIGSRYVPAINRAVAGLRPGDRLLTQDAALKEFAPLKRQPSPEAIVNLSKANTGLAPVQAWAAHRIAARFKLRIIRRDAQGFVVAALVPRQ
jgi:hypothetical protein